MSDDERDETPSGLVRWAPLAFGVGTLGGMGLTFGVLKVLGLV